jgi:hypothetical protein
MFFKRYPSAALLAFVSSLFNVVEVDAQSFPYTIQHLSMVGPPGLNFTTFDSFRTSSLTWDIVQANNVTLQFTFSTAVSTVELVQGTAATAGNTVMDVLGKSDNLISVTLEII